MLLSAQYLTCRRNPRGQVQLLLGELALLSFPAASSRSFFFQYSSRGGPNIALPETTPILQKHKFLSFLAPEQDMLVPYDLEVLTLLHVAEITDT